MKPASAWNATSVLCALWLGACASTTVSTAKVDTPDAAKSQTADSGLAPNADTASIAKDLPSTLDGEIRRAQLLRSKGDLDDAGRALAQLMLVEPDDARVVGEYGKVLAQQGHSQAALPYLQRATQLQPRDWTLYSALGVVYDQTDDHSHARLAYQHALELSPGQPSVLNNIAVSRMLTGDYAGAQRLLSQASAEKAGNPKIANNVDMLASLRPLAAPMSKAAPMESRPAPRSAERVAVAPPQPVSQAVVMQSVPADPLAGPVKTKPVARPKLTGTAKPQHLARADAPPPPALRTAAESN